MPDAAPDPVPQATLVAAMRYRDADAAIAWLETALGFSQRAVYRDGAGRVAHAELTFDTPSGTGMVMLGSVKAAGEADEAPWYRQPSDTGGVTACMYLITADCAGLYAKAQAAHAEVLSPLRTMDYGGEAFSVRDPEGFVWGIGQYNLWA